jgi:hypothetical protein
MISDYFKLKVVMTLVLDSFVFVRILFRAHCERALSEHIHSFVVFNYLNKQAKYFTLLPRHIRAVCLIADVRIPVELILVLTIVLGVLNNFLRVQKGTTSSSLSRSKHSSQVT